MDINLIPVEMRPKRPSKVPYLFAALVYISTILFFISKVGTVAGLNRETRSDLEYLSTLRTNISMYSGADRELQSVTGRADKLIAKAGLFKYISDGNIPLGSIIREIGAVTPDGLWYEELEISHPAEEFSFKGFGKGEIRERVIALRYSLEQSEELMQYFNRVELVSSGVHPDSDGLMMFEIKMVFKEL